jgi:hypothetical protein
VPDNRLDPIREPHATVRERGVVQVQLPRFISAQLGEAGREAHVPNAHLLQVPDGALIENVAPAVVPGPISPSGTVAI